jgi:hypothetical protein
MVGGFNFYFQTINFITNIYVLAADAVDIITLKIALEVNRKVSDLFLTHLNQFNF